MQAEDDQKVPAASSVAAPKKSGVSGIWEYRCHLCRLTKSHPKLVELIHERHFRDRLPYSAIMEEVNGYIAANRLDIKPIAHSSFTAHFQRHVPGDAAFLHAVQAEHESRNSGAAAPAQPDDVLAHVLAFKRENIQALQQNLARWQKIADRAYQEIDSPDNQDLYSDEAEDGGRRAHGSPLAIKSAFGRFSTATQSITAITSTLDRYVNGKDFVIAVLREGIDHFTHGLALALGTELAAILEEAATKEVSAADMGEWMHARLSAAMAKQLNQLRDTTQQIVTDKYRLKGA